MGGIAGHGRHKPAGRLSLRAAAHVGDRQVLYAASSITTAIAEAFGATRVIELSRDGPYIAGFRLTRAIRLLDLASDWPTRAGASQAISSGRKDVARAWARAIFDEYDNEALAPLLDERDSSGPN